MQPRRGHPEILKFARDLRNNPTDAEKSLWAILRSKKLDGHRFRRQHRIGDFILDFYCPERHLCIELDGGQHTDDTKLKYDQQRTLFLNRFGICVLRFSNIDVLKHRDAVGKEILSHLESPPPPPSPGVPGEGEK